MERQNIDCKTVVFGHFWKVLSVISVILECEAREPHTPGKDPEVYGPTQLLQFVAFVHSPCEALLSAAHSLYIKVSMVHPKLHGVVPFLKVIHMSISLYFLCSFQIL